MTICTVLRRVPETAHFLARRTGSKGEKIIVQQPDWIISCGRPPYNRYSTAVNGYRVALDMKENPVGEDQDASRVDLGRQRQEQGSGNGGAGYPNRQK